MVSLPGGSKINRTCFPFCLILCASIQKRTHRTVSWRDVLTRTTRSNDSCTTRSSCIIQINIIPLLFLTYPCIIIYFPTLVLSPTYPICCFTSFFCGKKHPKPIRGLVMTFELPDKSLKDFFWRARPLGIEIGTSLPIVVEKITSQRSKNLGIQVGFSASKRNGWALYPRFLGEH